MNAYLAPKRMSPKLYENIVISIAVGVAAAVFWLIVARNIGFDLSDEGYLWYGTQRLLHGEMPMRDFLAYDLGRYIYSALFLYAFQDSGLMSIRFAASFLISFLVALVVFITISAEKERTLLPKSIYGLTVGFLALLLVYPYYKVFDLTASVVLVLSIYSLFLRPNFTSWSLLGFVVGSIAVVNRNHGVYGVLASLLAYSLLLVTPAVKKPHFKELGIWGFGIFIGYLPTLMAFVFVDGFFNSFLNGIQEQLRNGQTNISLPVPWPWTVDIKVLGWVTSFPYIVKGFGFLLLLGFSIFGVMFILRHRNRVRTDASAFAAALCVAIPYSHYAFSRADITHLTLSLYPVMIGLLTIPVGVRLETRILFTVLLTTLTCTISRSPPVLFYADMGRDWEKIRVRTDELFVRRTVAESYERLTGLIESQKSYATSFVALPDMPGLHAIYESRIPIYDIYILSVTDPSREKTETQMLSKYRPNLILISDEALDSDEMLRFSILRPYMYKWINDNYHRTLSTSPRGHSAFEIYTAK